MAYPIMVLVTVNQWQASEDLVTDRNHAFEVRWLTEVSQREEQGGYEAFWMGESCQCRSKSSIRMWYGALTVSGIFWPQN